MKDYYVGDVDRTSFPSKPTYTPAKQATYNPDKSSEFLIKILQFLVPLAILGLAVAVRFLTKNTNVSDWHSMHYFEDNDMDSFEYFLFSTEGFPQLQMWNILLAQVIGYYFWAMSFNTNNTWGSVH